MALGLTEVLVSGFLRVAGRPRGTYWSIAASRVHFVSSWENCLNIIVKFLKIPVFHQHYSLNI